MTPPSAGSGAAPRHLLHRLELEIVTGEETLARALLPRLSRLHSSQLAVVLERVCEELSPEDRVHRLDTLALDLGRLRPEALEEQLPQRLEDALREALAERLPASASPFAPPVLPAPSPPPAGPPPLPAAAAPGRPESDPPPAPPNGGDLKLLATFAATGALPWWAPRDQPSLIPDGLERLLRPAAAPGPAAAGGRPDNALQPLLQALLSRPGALDRLRRVATPEQRSLLEAAIAALAPPPAAAASAAGPPVSPALALPAPTRLPAPEAAPLPPSRPRAGFQEWPIDGAGLVLLWPFLDTLCQRLGLLREDRQFRSEAERQRAVALFGLLVDEGPELLEWRLTLAKVLCGLPPDHSWSLETPIQPEELEELRGVWAAALLHAEGRLGDDPEALRQGLLRRPGLLTALPGAWLLQVERREGDASLAQLPWSLEWLRLPWMARGLQVRW